MTTRPNLETLEDRIALAGYTLLANAPPSAVSTTLLLTNGDVMAQSAAFGSTTWYELTPVNGSYVNGVWSTLASSINSRNSYGSVVLPDGDVMFLGGEFSSAGGDNTPDGAIYHGKSNAWTAIAPFPEASFGDGELMVLPDGNVLAGSTHDATTWIYAPASNTWTQTGSKAGGDPGEGETWVKLPGGGVLDYDVEGYPQYGQVYSPTSGTWTWTGQGPALASSQPEIGPAMLLYSGQVFFLGATGETGLYNPASNAWTQGPTIPGGNVADDAPAAELPDGNVLFIADQPGYTAPSQVFEYNPASNTITSVPTPPGDYSGEPAFPARMLLLPTGQVLMTDGITDSLVVYSEAGAAPAGVAPTIASVLPDADGSYTVAGTNLNGWNEGASYGDDAQMASNYPLVTLSAGGNTVFATTYGWSSVVATGAQVVSTQFMVPAGLNPGTYSLTVIANGVSSIPVEFPWPASSYLAGVEQSLDLQYTGRWYTVQYGINADWLQSANGSNTAHYGWYFILADGTLHQWDGVQGSATGQSSATVALMDTSLWQNPLALATAGYTPPAGLDLQFTGAWDTTYRGMDADWYQSGNGSNTAYGGWYFLTPQGLLYSWTGGTSGALVAPLDQSYWWFPGLLLG